MFPSESHATSVGWRKSPFTAGKGGLTCSHGLLSSSADSLASENHLHTACLIEHDDHVRAFVDSPDVVVLVYPDRVGFRPPIKALADFAKEIAFGTELEQLRRCRSVGGTGGRIRARKDINISLRIHRHTGNLAEIHARRKLEKVRRGIERNLRHALLRDQRQRQQYDDRNA